jgi:uncharacterized protein (DUF1800 family)
MEDFRKNVRQMHLYRRAGMGFVPPQNMGLKEVIDKLFKDSENFDPIQISPIPGEVQPENGTMKMEDKEAAKREMKLMERKYLRDLNVKWIDLMTNSEATLRERMSLFWHGHFACRTVIPAFAESYINTIRKHALGDFGEMLMAVSKEPAMLQFLNNQQNRKNSPNENFAREVMELFTIGRGNYTEDDVKEGARAFTGWAFNYKGEFQFKERSHDTGVKEFLGEKGAFDGADIIRILLKKREAARFITSKIYKALVSEVPDHKRIEKLSDGFYKSNYNIGLLLREIFTSEWFYDTPPKNVLIKSPVELLVGMQKTFGGSMNQQGLLYIQKFLGQVLFNPPNVAGWPGGRTWIDSSSLLLRMQLPSLMVGGSESKLKAKESGDDNDAFVARKGNNLRVEANWDKWVQVFDGVPLEKLSKAIAARLLVTYPGDAVIKLVSPEIRDDADRVRLIREITQKMMSLPEFQVV